MNPLRIDVTVRGSRWVAESGEPQVTAVGGTAEQAAENARGMALTMFARTARPPMLLVRIEEPDVSTILMQPSDEPVSLEASSEKRKWRYMASVKKA